MTVVVGLVGAICATVATAAITSPASGQVFRGGVVPITESVGARRLLNDGVTEIVPFTGPGAPHNAACSTRDQTTPVNQTAHTLIKVFAPGQNINTDTPVASKLSDWRHVANTALGNAYDRGGPVTFNWTIPDDAVAGIYTAVVTVTDRRRTSTSALTQNTTLATCVQQTPVTTTVTFEYRPWTNKFKDVFNNGDVSFNIEPNPREFQATVLGKSTPILSGAGGVIRTFALSDPAAFTPPEDPAACAEDPAACLPAGAAECAPGDADCDARIVVIKWKGGGTDRVAGVFDMDSRAFVALVRYQGNQALMLSLGTEGDAALADLLAQIAALATEQGLDLMSILATRVKVTLHQGNQNQSTVVAVSLLRALQIYTEKPGGPTGVSIEAPITATVGLFAHSYSYTNIPNPSGVAVEARGCSTALASGKCTTSAAESSTQVGRFTPITGIGYNVGKSDLLPDLPKVALPALPTVPGLPVSQSTLLLLAGIATSAVPTKFFNIYGSWPGGNGKHRVPIGVATNPGEPNGLPVWVAPLSTTPVPEDPTSLTDPTVLLITALGVLAGGPTFADKAMDFLGTASWSTRESCNVTVCTAISGSMTGLGVGIFSDAPLPIGFRDIPIWDPMSPEVQALIAQINLALSDANGAANEQIAALLEDPTIQMVLAAIFDNMPEVPETPELPV